MSHVMKRAGVNAPVRFRSQSSSGTSAEEKRVPSQESL
jgi:hypothetical protein